MGHGKEKREARKKAKRVKEKERMVGSNQVKGDLGAKGQAQRLWCSVLYRLTPFWDDINTFLG